MPRITLPDAGVALGAATESSIGKGPGTPTIAPGTKQVFRVRFERSELLNELLRCKSIEVTFGRSIVSS